MGFLWVANFSRSRLTQHCWTSHCHSRTWTALTVSGLLSIEIGARAPASWTAFDLLAFVWRSSPCYLKSMQADQSSSSAMGRVSVSPWKAEFSMITGAAFVHDKFRLASKAQCYWFHRGSSCHALCSYRAALFFEWIVDAWRQILETWLINGISWQFRCGFSIKAVFAVFSCAKLLIGISLLTALV